MFGGKEVAMRNGKIRFRVFILLCIILSTAFNLTHAFGATLNVPTLDYPTIQAGIDAAVDGDTVLVADGTYTGTGNKDLDFKGKAITVRSENGPATTIIDCEGDGRGFDFHSAETDSSVLSGFTITNGQAEHGGGIRLNASSPTINNCHINANSADWGSGIHINASSSIITACKITENSASYEGGGLLTYEAPATLVNCLIAGNTAARGGGVFTYGAAPTFINCTISDNLASDQGGALYNSVSSPVITNCILWGNTPNETYQFGDLNPDISYCAIQGGFPGEGNFNSDPLFVDAQNEDYHLSIRSPCIYAANTADAPDSDLEGNSRPQGPRYDIGAYEATGYASSRPFIDTFTADVTHGDVPLEVTFTCSANDPDGEIESYTIDYGDGSPAENNSSGVFSHIYDSRGVFNSTCVVQDDAGILVNSVPLEISTIGELYVPAVFSTIQAAIDAANDGDTIIVADGRYTGAGNKDIDFKGKAITVRSENGPENSIIDCEGEGQGFYFQSGETESSVLEGITITNGNSVYGGGLRFNSASPAIKNCIIAHNLSHGIECNSSSPTISNSVISNNSGGGIVCNSSSPALVNCVIRDNSGGDRGGGISCSYSSPTLINCLISGNSASQGGGMYCMGGSSPVMTNCTISHNSADDGGGLYLSQSPATITNCILWGNTAGEILIEGSGYAPEVTYSDIQGGFAGEGNFHGDPLFLDPENDDYHLAVSSPCMYAGTAQGAPDTDIEGNSRPQGYGFDLGAYETTGYDKQRPIVDSFTSETTEAFVPFETTFSCSAHDPDGEIVSYTIDYGDGSAPESSSSCEFTYTYQTAGLAFATITVTDDSGAAVNSTSIRIIRHGDIFVPAYHPTIQAALDAAFDGDTVIVADGTYKGAGNKNLDFRGKVITVISENGPDKTIIDCEEDGRGFYFHNGEGHDSVVSGFTIMNGQAFGGGGIFCDAASPTITNCIIQSNSAGSGRGGGIYCKSSSPIITNCTIRDNNATGGGGGINCFDSSPEIKNCTISGNGGGGLSIFGVTASPEITNCNISDNSDIGGNAGGIYCRYGSPIINNCTINKNVGRTAGGIVFDQASGTVTNCSINENEGGGINCWSSSPTISACIIQGNSAFGSGDGAGITCTYSSAPIIQNCLISKNSSGENGRGGGVYSSGSSPTIINCTIAENSAGTDGGGVYSYGSSSLNISNSIVSGNAPEEIYYSGDIPTITYSTIPGGWPGEGNIPFNPDLEDPANDNYRLKDYSICIGSGTTAGSPASDIEGSPRPNPAGSNPDMGAYEHSRGFPDARPMDIFGVEMDNSWTYQGTFQTNIYTLEKVVASISNRFSPISTYVIEYTIDGSSKAKDWIEKTSSELKLWQEQDFFGNYHGYSKGLINAWYPMQVGDQKYSTATTSIEGYDFNISLKADVLLLETVNLGFDSIEAYKIKYKVRVWGHGIDEKITFYYWVVPYLGFVKYKDDNQTEILTAFTIGSGIMTEETDADGDGLMDYEELIIYGTNWRNSDTDDDGLTDNDELGIYGTDPKNEDSDNDGLNDGDEVNTHDTDPLNADTDNDGLSDGDEINTFSTDPLDEDSDDDGLSDGAEVNTHGTDPADADTDGDGLTDGDEVNTYGTDPLKTDTDGDGLSDKEEVDLGRHPSNWEPDQTELYLPPDEETDVLLTVELETDPFLDRDEDAHDFTQWQIGKQIGNPEPCTDESFTNSDYKVFDGTSDMQLTLFQVPDLLLDVDTNYCWRARFTDTGGATSEWADPFSFLTIAQTEDDQDPQNGIPDEQEADCSAIFDPGEIPPDTVCVDTLVGNAQVGIEPAANVVSIDAFKSVDPQDIPQNLKNVDLIVGLMSFKAEVEQVGDIMELTFHSSVPMPAKAECYKYDPVNGWQNYHDHVVAISADRRSITLEYKDGGFGDLDGVANKIVIDPVGFGVATGGGGGGGGGGCLISTAADVSGMPKESLALILVCGFLMIGLMAFRKTLRQ